MAKSPIWTFLAVAALIAQAAPAGVASAYGAECKRKIVGFYLEEMDASRPRKLSNALQNLPGSLTGVPGNAEHGRDVLIGAQKGSCVSCHRVGTLSPAIAQGSIGPSLDGAGSKYNEGQFRQVLLQPKAYFPETIMPSYYRAGNSEASVLTAAEIEDLVAYLGTLK
jgi:L-cysteine S-thiosulfotransferase